MFEYEHNVSHVIFANEHSAMSFFCHEGVEG